MIPCTVRNPRRQVFAAEQMETTGSVFSAALRPLAELALQMAPSVIYRLCERDSDCCNPSRQVRRPGGVLDERRGGDGQRSRRELGYGGESLVVAATGISRPTIRLEGGAGER